MSVSNLFMSPGKGHPRQSKVDPLTKLPLELCIQICAHLRSTDLFTLTQTSTAFRRMVEENATWVCGAMLAAQPQHSSYITTCGSADLRGVLRISHGLKSSIVERRVLAPRDARVVSRALDFYAGPSLLQTAVFVDWLDMKRIAVEENTRRAYLYHTLGECVDAITYICSTFPLRR